MNKNNRVTVVARHAYTEAYANYLKSGNLAEATRQVAHDIWQHRGNKPGTPQSDWQEAERITSAWPDTVTAASNAHMYDKAMSKTRAWLQDVQCELDCDNLNEAYRSLRAVLHAIRDRLPAEECVEFAAQMPVLIMGMYYAGWTPSHKPEKLKTPDDFLDKVASRLPPGEDPLRVTTGILRVLERHISWGELKDVRRNFPERVRELWETASPRSR